MKKKFTELQREAIKDALVHGELARTVAYVDFCPGSHKGQTIKSLIDKGLLETVDVNHNGYPMRVKVTSLASWDDL
jgi:hypothetical protein